MNRARTIVAGGYLALAILLGGTSVSNPLGNGLLQLLAIAIILMHVWTKGAPPLSRSGRWLVALYVAFAAVAAAQLIPLPPSIWTALPGREVVVRSLALLGRAPTAMPVSLDPARTVGMLLWLLPPAAMFLVTTRLTRDERSVVARVLLGATVISVGLAALQLLGGDASHLRLYAASTAVRGVGTFANSNHLAALLLSALPFAGVFIARARKSRGSGGSEGKVIAYAAIGAFIAVGILINGSLAAYGLLIPTGIAAYLIYRRSLGRPLRTGDWVGAAVALILAMGVSALGPMSDERIAAKFDANDAVGRRISVPVTLDAAEAHFPVGSGFGTFRDIYRTFEPAENASSVYVIHAHNEYAELALELGLPGILLMLGFLAWWGTRTFAVWRSDFDGAALARAGSVVIGLALIHSLVDFPLRTSAIAAVAALAAGFMIQAPAARRRSGGERGTELRDAARHMNAESV